MSVNKCGELPDIFSGVMAAHFWHAQLMLTSLRRRGRRHLCYSLTKLLSYQTTSPGFLPCAAGLYS